jgi:hypothetical protein
MADTTILPLANALLDCLTTELALNVDPPASACLRVGNQVIHDVDAAASLDKVCCPGFNYVRVGQVYPSTDFPQPDVRNDKCLSLARAVEFTAGVVRCVPGMGSAAGPTCPDWTLAALHDANDIDALFKAVCCFTDTTEFKRMKGRRWAIQTSTVEQTADCVERMLLLTVEVRKCC